MRRYLLDTIVVGLVLVGTSYLSAQQGPSTLLPVSPTFTSATLTGATALTITGSTDSATSTQFVVNSDSTLAAGVGNNTTSFNGVERAILKGANLTKTAVQEAAYDGVYWITGTNASIWPKGAVIGEIHEGTTTADGAVVAVMGGDSGLTTSATGAFAVRYLNSTGTNRFTYGLDLGTKVTGYETPAYTNADINFNSGAWFVAWNNLPLTANVTTTAAPSGSLAITTNATGLGTLFYSDGAKWQAVVNNIVGGVCTNQMVTVISVAGVPTCTPITNAYIAASTIAASKLVGTDIATVGTITAGTWSATTIAVNKGGTGTTSTLVGLVRGSASAMTAAELSGDATTSASNAVTVVKVNGVAYASGPSTNTVPVITASNTATYTAITNCTDTGGNHLNYTTSTSLFSCGTSAGASTPKIMMATIFETALSGRFTVSNVGAGTTTFANSDGLVQTTSATISNSSSVVWVLVSNTDDVCLGNPTFTFTMSPDAIGTDLQTYGGLGAISVGAATIDYTVRHIGFKIVRAASGAINLSGTQADGTTEAATAVLTTVALTDNLDLIVTVNSGTSATYYWRKTGGALSAGTTTSTNMPSTCGIKAQFMSTNSATATNSQWSIQSASYSR